MKDILGQAMHDFYFKHSPGKLWIHNTYGEKEDMPVKLYFREKKRMPRLEQVALQECKGSILDIGAGAGSHALALQQAGLEVTAIDISPKAVEVMKHRGVIKAEVADVFTYTYQHRFDTILLMMNGIGITENIEKLKLFLRQLKHMLAAGGQLIFDSSDIAYLYDYKLPEREAYYGEIKYQYEYKKEKTDWFSWLYIDSTTLATIANDDGWNVDLLFQDQFDQYLVKLTVKD